MNRKTKGTNGERELVKFFNESGWGCIRIAGSGSSRYPSPDILAGNAVRRIAVECKVTKDQKKYLLVDDVEQLMTFSQKFGAESWIAIRFPGGEWFFLMPEDLEKTGSGFAASLDLARRKGLTPAEIILNNSPGK